MLRKYTTSVVWHLNKVLFEDWSKKAEILGNSTIVLRPWKTYTIIGVLGSILWGLLLFMSFTVFWESGGTLGILSISICFICSGIYLIWFWQRHSIVLDSDKIVSYSAFRKTITLSWSEIKNTSYWQVSWWLTLSNQKKKIRIHRSLIGFNDWLKEIQLKVNHLESWNTTKQKISKHKL